MRACKNTWQRKNSWLLFNVKDKFISKDDITLKDKSVISNKTLAQVEKTTTNLYGSKCVKETSSKSKKEKALNKSEDVKAVSAKNKADKKNEINSLDKIDTKGKRAKFPVKLSPMMATLVDKPFDNEGWQYEIKWDGYRTNACAIKIKWN